MPAHHTHTTGLVIQARMGSVRLRGKVLKPFDGPVSILQMLIRRFGAAFPAMPLLVATSTASTDDIVTERAIAEGALVFRGSEEDVLDRFIGAMEANGLSACLRICADNPFLITDFAKELLDASKCSNHDYMSHRVSGTPAMQTHYGVFTEYVTLAALTKASTMPIPPDDRQHVTKFLYEHPDLFDVRWLDADISMEGVEDIRMTVDTLQDFEISQTLWRQINTPNEHLDWPSLKQQLLQETELRNRMWLERSKQPK
ncbi:MAG: hypothetical protein JNN12_08530 [Bacteroidetes Order II. Incertae sedis bacterium]|nr:hypothetical protein [Bacteroidetes Order II. bacterium]